MLRRKHLKQLLKLPRRDRPADKILPPLEILPNKGTVVEVEIILYKLHCALVVLDHLTRILSYNMHLLDLVFIKPFQFLVIIGFVLDLVILFDSFDPESLVDHQEPSFDRQCICLGQIKNGIFDHFA